MSAAAIRQYRDAMRRLRVACDGGSGPVERTLRWIEARAAYAWLPGAELVDARTAVVGEEPTSRVPWAWVLHVEPAEGEWR